MKVKCHLVFSDGQDGSYTINIVPTKEKGLEILDRTEEQLEEGTVYEDGVIKEVTLDIEEKNGKFFLKKGCTVSIS